MKKFKKLFSKIATALAIACLGAIPTFATEPSPAPALSIDFDTSAMFVWAQTIISAMMPIVYITMGLGLGFLIITSLRNAFR